PTLRAFDKGMVDTIREIDVKGMIDVASSVNINDVGLSWDTKGDNVKDDNVKLVIAD
ncbi:hypothetical protein KI387_024364, partial [Taxus chinensis]